MLHDNEVFRTIFGYAYSLRKVTRIQFPGYSAIFGIAILMAMGPTVAHADTWGPYRGVNVEPNIKEQDIASLSRMHANLVRVSFDSNPLMKKSPPYGINDDAFVRLDNIISWCAKYGIKVVIDPHTTPGTRRNTTTLPGDPLWRDAQWHDHLIKLWSFIAARYRHTGSVIAGYDILNEPAAPMGYPSSGPGDWNSLAKAVVNAIRAKGDRHWIIVETAVGSDREGHVLDRLRAVSKLNLPDDANIVLSVHMYVPLQLTHQGVGGRKLGFTYPGDIEGVRYDSKKLASLMQPVRTFQNTHGVPVFIGEFGASIYGGASADRYIGDLMSIFDGYDWSWAYHNFRASHAWDPEYPILRQECVRVRCPRSENTDRMELLKKHWQKNVISDQLN